MHALIDLDILCYEIGSAKDEDRIEPLPWPLVKARVDARIEQIIDVTESDTWEGYLTGEGNFRKEVATIRPYKGHRPTEKPYWYESIYNYLRDIRLGHVVDGMEADDAIVIAHMRGDGDTIICSRDKDFRQVWGWHYTWPSWKQEEQRPFWLSVVNGTRFFYKQLLTGDTADNIPGLYGVGDRSAHLGHVDDLTTELSMFEYVKEQYEKRFGSYWSMFLEENGKLLWLKRNASDEWKYPGA